MGTVTSGLDNFISNKTYQQGLGKTALLCHSASIDKNYEHALHHLQKLLGANLVSAFGPQHGFVTDVQDNMIETEHVVHPHYKIPIHSLYSETRRPTEEMLKGLNTIIVDLQDIGTRIYTYITSLAYMMEECGKRGIKVIVLDRPNPIGGLQIEGNILDQNFKSFVGYHPIPTRHSLTIGEIAKFTREVLKVDCDLQIIEMKGWKRSMYFDETGLPLVNPSPNIPNIESCVCFPATVLFEGTKLSEGRGTTRPLEVIGHPKLDAYAFCKSFEETAKEFELKGFLLRPISFYPMFQKHAETSCNGFHIHILERKACNVWRLGQALQRELKKSLGSDYEWQDQPYEYQTDRLAIDYINCSDKPRLWVEENGSFDKLTEIENNGRDQFMNDRENILLYK